MASANMDDGCPWDEDGVWKTSDRSGRRQLVIRIVFPIETETCGCGYSDI